MKISKIDWSFVNYPEPDTQSLDIYVSGCDGICDGCHSKETHPFDNGSDFTAETMRFISSQMSSVPDDLRFVSILGGEPLHLYNINGVIEIIDAFSRYCNICLYTHLGIDFVIRDLPHECISSIKYIKCGKFEIDKLQPSSKTLSAMTLSSRNQEMYKVDGSEITLISENGIVNFNNKL